MKSLPVIFITLFLLFLIPACYGGGGSGGGTSSDDTIFHVSANKVCFTCLPKRFILCDLYSSKEASIVLLNVTGYPIVWRGRPSMEAY